MTSSLDEFLFEFPDPPPGAQPAAPAASTAPAAGTEEVHALARIAAALFQWGRAAGEIEAKLADAGHPEAASRLRVAREEIAETLKETGVEIDDPLGRTMAEVIEHVSVRGWRHQEGALGETVSQVIAPIIRRRGVMLQRGQVVMTKAPHVGESPAENISTSKSAPGA